MVTIFQYQETLIERTTNSYINKIVVDKIKVSASEVLQKESDSDRLIGWLLVIILRVREN